MDHESDKLHEEEFSESFNKTLDRNTDININITTDIYGKLLIGNYKILSNG